MIDTLFYGLLHVSGMILISLLILTIALAIGKWGNK